MLPARLRVLALLLLTPAASLALVAADANEAHAQSRGQLSLRTTGWKVNIPNDGMTWTTSVATDADAMDIVRGVESNGTPWELAVMIPKKPNPSHGCQVFMQNATAGGAGRSVSTSSVTSSTSYYNTAAVASSADGDIALVCKDLGSHLLLVGIPRGAWPPSRIVRPMMDNLAAGSWQGTSSTPRPTYSGNSGSSGNTGNTGTYTGGYASEDASSDDGWLGAGSLPLTGWISYRTYAPVGGRDEIVGYGAGTDYSNQLFDWDFIAGDYFLEAELALDGGLSWDGQVGVSPAIRLGSLSIGGVAGAGVEAYRAGEPETDPDRIPTAAYWFVGGTSGIQFSSFGISATYELRNRSDTPAKHLDIRASLGLGSGFGLFGGFRSQSWDASNYGSLKAFYGGLRLVI